MNIFQKKCLFYIVMMLFIVSFFRLASLSGWDEAFYWAQLTSLWYDGDLTLHDDLLANYNDSGMKRISMTHIKADGALSNDFSIGTAVIDGIYAGPIVFIQRLFRLPRMSAFFLRVVGLGALLKIWVLVFALGRLLRKYSQQNPLMLYGTIASVFFGTPLIVYALNWYGMAHLNSALFATLFVLLLTTWLDNPTAAQSVALGAVAGFMMLVRWQNGVYSLLVLPPLLYKFFAASKNNRLRYLKGAGIVMLCALVIFSVQFAAWYKQFGKAVFMPQGAGFMQWTAPQWLPMFFSGYHGLFVWNPVVVLAGIGSLLAMIKSNKSRRWFMAGGLLAMLVMTYVNACVSDWWGGSAYGARRFCSLAPLFALGVAAFLQSLNKKAAVLIVLLVLGWSHFTYTCFNSRIDDLAVPFLDRRSHTSPTTDEYWISDGEYARHLLLKNLLFPQNRGFQVVGAKPTDFVDRVFIAMALLFSFLLAHKFHAVWYAYQKFRRGLPVIVIGYVLTLSVCITFVFPDSYRLNTPWKHYLDNASTPDETIQAGVPEAPVRFIEVLSLVSDGHIREAERVLASINAETHFNLKISEMIDRR